MINKDIQKLRENYIKLENILQGKKDEQRNILKKLQEKCNHPLIAEVDCEHSKMLVCASPPIRICEVCGYEEKGWGKGYHNLKGDRVRKMDSRESFYGLRKPIHDINIRLNPQTL